MHVSTIGADGRTTVPRQLRVSLGIRPGSRLVWHIMPTGAILVRPKTHSLLDLEGSLKSPKKRPVSIKAMSWR